MSLFLDLILTQQPNTAEQILKSLHKSSLVIQGFMKLKHFVTYLRVSRFVRLITSTIHGECRCLKRSAKYLPWPRYSIQGHTCKRISSISPYILIWKYKTTNWWCRHIMSLYQYQIRQVDTRYQLNTDLTNQWLLTMFSPLWLYYRVKVYLPFIDTQQHELNRRFKGTESTKSDKVLQLLYSLTDLKKALLR